MFKSKEEKRIERDIEVRKGVNSLKRNIRDLAKHEMSYIVKAKKAKKIGDSSQYDFLKRQLKKTAALRRYVQKDHSDEQPHGIVEQLLADGYGFIRTVDDNRQFYFHRNSVLHDGFERLAVGTEVRFSAEEGEQGPQASSVQIVGKPGVSSQH